MNFNIDVSGLEFDFDTVVGVQGVTDYDLFWVMIYINKKKKTQIFIKETIMYILLN